MLYKLMTNHMCTKAYKKISMTDKCFDVLQHISFYILWRPLIASSVIGTVRGVKFFTVTMRW